MERSAHSDTFARDNLPPLDQWPELLLEGNPDVAYPARLNCAAELVDRHVDEGRGDRIALRWPEGDQDKSLTYAQLQRLTNQIAQVLVEDMGLVSGNRVLLRGPNNAMMAASWLAVVKAGMVAVPTGDTPAHPSASKTIAVAACAPRASSLFCMQRTALSLLSRMARWATARSMKCWSSASLHTAEMRGATSTQRTWAS